MAFSLFRGIGPGIMVRPNIGAIITGLSYFSGDLRSLREPLEQAISKVVVNRIDENFRTESDAFGNRWKSLSTRTRDERRRQLGPSKEAHPILQRTGTLHSEAMQKKIWTFRGDEGIAFVTASSFTQAPYAYLLDQGGPTWEGFTIPARPFMQINEEDVNEIQDIIEEFIAERANSRLPSIGVAATMLGRFRAVRAGV